MKKNISRTNIGIQGRQLLSQIQVTLIRQKKVLDEQVCSNLEQIMNSSGKFIFPLEPKIR
jgi:hypothetical protein